MLTDIVRKTPRAHGVGALEERLWHGDMRRKRKGSKVNVPEFGTFRVVKSEIRTFKGKKTQELTVEGLGS